MTEINSKTDEQFSDSYSGRFSTFVSVKDKSGKVMKFATIVKDFINVLLGWQSKYADRKVKITIETIEGDIEETKTESRETTEQEITIKEKDAE